MNNAIKSMGKLALGTVQFGLEYGINNIIGRVKENEVKKILSYCKQIGINTLDTAFSYGNSELIIGKLTKEKDANFNIISKAPKNVNCDNIKFYFKKSLSRLNKKFIYGYLLHDFNDYLNGRKIFDILKKIRDSGEVQKIGFSLYYPEHLEILMKNKEEFDILQIPYNLLDRRFEKYFEKLGEKGVEIHIRSVFLQGLFFMDESSLPKKLVVFKDFLNELKKFSYDNKISIEEIALNFVFMNKYVDRIIIGVETKEQLENNVLSIKKQFDENLLKSFLVRISQHNIPNHLLLPTNW